MDKVKVLFNLTLSDFRNSIALGVFPGFGRLSRGVWRIGGMLLTSEKGITRRKVCRRATFSAINLTRTGLGSTPDLRNDRLETHHL